MGELVTFVYPDGMKVEFDEDYWLYFGEMTVRDMMEDCSSTINVESPYEQD